MQTETTAARSADATTGRSTASLPISATTGSPVPARSLASAIGALLGGRGAGERRSAEGLPALPPIRATDVPTDAWRLDHPTRSLPPPLASLLGEPVYPSPTSETPTRYVIRGNATDEQRALAAEALRVYRALCAPLNDVEIGHRLARMRAKTAARREEGAAAELTIDAWCDLLGHFPADIVIDAIDQWCRLERWWPTEADLRAIMAPRVQHRAAIIRALEEALA